MTTRDYLSANISGFVSYLPPAIIDGALVSVGADPDANFTQSDRQKVDLALLEIIPKLLLTPDVTEGGYSVKYDRNAISQYYRFLCEKLGVENKLERKPTIRDASDLW